jgi:hypothetical protein
MRVVWVLSSPGQGMLSMPLIVLQFLMGHLLLVAPELMVGLGVVLATGAVVVWERWRDPLLR